MCRPASVRRMLHNSHKYKHIRFARVLNHLQTRSVNIPVPGPHFPKQVTIYILHLVNNKLERFKNTKAVLSLASLSPSSSSFTKHRSCNQFDNVSWEQGNSLKSDTLLVFRRLYLLHPSRKSALVFMQRVSAVNSWRTYFREIEYRDSD